MRRDYDKCDYCHWNCSIKQFKTREDKTWSLADISQWPMECPKGRRSFFYLSLNTSLFRLFRKKVNPPITQTPTFKLPDRSKFSALADICPTKAFWSFSCYFWIISCISFKNYHPLFAWTVCFSTSYNNQFTSPFRKYFCNSNTVQRVS